MQFSAPIRSLKSKRALSTSLTRYSTFGSIPPRISASKKSQVSSEPPSPSSLRNSSDEGAEQKSFVTGWGADELAPRGHLSDDELTVDASPQWTPETEMEKPILIARGSLNPSSAKNASPLRRLSRAPSNRVPVPQLAHSLDRVLFNPSIHWLQDPRSGVFNFRHHLQSIPSVNSFDFDRIPGFVPSSKDKELRDIAKGLNKRFVGSTSSLTFLLAHIYYLVSREKPVEIDSFSSEFKDMSRDFTEGMTTPGSISIKYDAANSVYAVDSSSGPDALEEFDVEHKNILTWMGTMLEKFLTLPSNAFNTLLKRSGGRNKNRVSPLVPQREAYQFSSSRHFIMRSQLDCQDKRLPGTGVFDIKARAALAIRHDKLNYEQAAGYIIKNQRGLYESFEREMYDLIRSAMLKYNFQARIGNMDGIFVAYHNTAKIFGFQYLTVPDMDAPLFGNYLAGKRVFTACIELLDALARALVKIQSNLSCECTFEGTKDALRLWLEFPTTQKQSAQTVELVLKVDNYINDSLVPAESPPRFGDEDAKWTLKYKILRTPQSEQANVEKRLAKAKEKQFLISRLVLPPGVESSDEIRVLWEDIDFGRNPKTSPKPSKSDIDYDALKKFFMPPYPLVLKTRELAEEAQKEIVLHQLERETKRSNRVRNRRRTMRLKKEVPVESKRK